MRDLTVGVFEHLEITSIMDVIRRVAYTQRILKGAAINNYREVLVGSRHLEKELDVDEWKLDKLGGLGEKDLECGVL